MKKHILLLFSVLSLSMPFLANATLDGPAAEGVILHIDNHSQKQLMLDSSSGTQTLDPGKVTDITLPKDRIESLKIKDSSGDIIYSAPTPTTSEPSSSAATAAEGTIRCVEQAGTTTCK